MTPISCEHTSKFYPRKTFQRTVYYNLPFFSYYCSIHMNHLFRCIHNIKYWCNTTAVCHTFVVIEILSCGRFSWNYFVRVRVRKTSVKSMIVWTGL